MAPPREHPPAPVRGPPARTPQGEHHHSAVSAPTFWQISETATSSKCRLPWSSFKQRKGSGVACPSPQGCGFSEPLTLDSRLGCRLRFSRRSPVTSAPGTGALYGSRWDTQQGKDGHAIWSSRQGLCGCSVWRGHGEPSERCGVCGVGRAGVSRTAWPCPFIRGGQRQFGQNHGLEKDELPAQHDAIVYSRVNHLGHYEESRPLRNQCWWTQSTCFLSAML